MSRIEEPMPTPAAHRTLQRALAPLFPLYSTVVRLRNSLYNWGVLPQHSLSTPVISIGNLSVGGTGKTPFVLKTAEILLQMGHNPIILSRGYGGAKNRSPVLLGTNGHLDPRRVGDEATLLATRLPRTPIVVCRDRWLAAEWANATLQTDCFLLDDGFQHRRLQRDLDIVLIDLTTPCSNGQLLPLGRLREPFQALRRADAIVLTRAEVVKDTVGIVETIRRRNPDAPFFHLRYEAAGLYSVSRGFRQPSVETKGVKSVLFAGIGNPQYFRYTAEQYGLAVVRLISYRDHYQYTWNDIRKLLAALRAEKAEYLITTEKDAIRLQHLHVENLPLYFLRIEPVIDEEEMFQALLRETLRISTRSP